MMTTMYEEMLTAHAPIPAPPCAFCSKHGRGETIAVSVDCMHFKDEFDLEWYDDIKFCPLCGKRLKAYAVLDHLMEERQ